MAASSCCSLIVPSSGFRGPSAKLHTASSRSVSAALNGGLPSSSVFPTPLRKAWGNVMWRNLQNCRIAVSFIRSITRVNRALCTCHRVVCSAASASGGQNADADENPYQVLGVNPLERFDTIKVAYAKKHKDAERKGDEATLARIERAYDKIMMAQLANRKQGLTFGSFEVSKDIKYADKQPLFPWGPRSAPLSKNDILINLAISALFGAWIISARSADWKPFQFLIFGYMWRIFNKLKDFEPAVPSFSSDEEDPSKRNKSGKRLLRTLGLVFSCVAFSSLAFTGILNVYELLGMYIPRVLINSQELFVTVVSSVLLFFMGSYYR